MCTGEAVPSVSPLNGCLCVVFSGRFICGWGTRRGSDLLLVVAFTRYAYVRTLSACVFQVIVQSGRQPSVLQKLCQLPFQYFSHPHLIKVLFPSLISACYNNQQNKVILQQEMSCVLLATFMQVRYGFSYRKRTHPCISRCGHIDITLPQSKRLTHSHFHTVTQIAYICTSLILF